MSKKTSARKDKKTGRTASKLKSAERLSFQQLAKVTKACPTPFFFYDGPHLLMRARTLKAAVQAKLPTSIHYAVKANANRHLLGLFKREGLACDVVSWGEAKSSMQAGFNAEDVLFSGVAKTVDEITLAIRAGVKQINVESLQELERIEKFARDLKPKRPVSLGIRLNPNVCPETHPYITTGLHENKFGLEEDDVLRAVKLIDTSKAALSLRGLSLHIGSQLLDLGPLDEAMGIARDLQYDIRRNVANRWRCPMDRFDAGGGIGIRYESADESAELELAKTYATLLEKHCLSDVKSGSVVDVMIEPGRWLVARSGSMITEVQYTKSNAHKSFAIVDGGMNLIIRPALYQAHHRIELLPHQASSSRTKTKTAASADTDAAAANQVVDVVGPICESADFLARDRKLPKLTQGDRLAVLDAGAYGRTMTSNYNQRGWPGEYFFDGKKLLESRSP